MRERTVDLGGAADAAETRLSMVAELLRGNAGALADTADRSATKLDALGEALVRRAAELSAMSDGTAARIATVDSALGQQRENLIRTLEALGARADELDGVTCEPQYSRPVSFAGKYRTIDLPSTYLASRLIYHYSPQTT